MIARVFPRKTNASPDDPLAFFGEPPEELPILDQVHISVTFTYDLPRAEELAKAWGRHYNVKIGGPAVGDPGGEFVPGMYLREGYTITSRGCPNKCWFCDVWKREGAIRELSIAGGWMLQDNNLLACSESHIRAVFAMLGRQKEPIHLSGGLEAARLKHWHIELLWNVRPKQIFFAYDTPDDLEPLIEAGRMLRMADFTRSHLRCYVLIGGPKDTISAAEQRLFEAWTAGFMPCAMLWRGPNNIPSNEWKQFQRVWARPAITKARIREILFND